VRDASTAGVWIGDVLECNVGRFEAIVWCRLYRAWQVPSDADVRAWNDAFLAARESAELRAETVQMGYSLRKLLCESGEFDEAILAPLRLVQEPAFPTAFSFACVAWRIPERQALLGYLWAWVENQVSAAMKAIPLGQMSGQRLLAAPGVLHDRGLAHVSDLRHDVEFAQPIDACVLVGDIVERRAVTLADVLNMPEPVVDQPE